MPRSHSFLVSTPTSVEPSFPVVADPIHGRICSPQRVREHQQPNPARAFSLCFLLTLASLAAVPARATAEDETVPTRALDIVFALDTTGSMGSMIGGAKEYIWGIARKLRSDQLDVRFGLVAFRDQTDAYVTQVHPFAGQMLQTEQRLRSFEAEGGGDTPEAVNQALAAAVDDFSWRPEARRIIFLVGDAPPHGNDPDSIQYAGTARRAQERGIKIHTLLCGEDEEAKKVWQEIAQLAGGSFIQLDLATAVQTHETPYDRLLRSIQRQLAQTVVPYGNPDQREAVETLLGDQNRDSAHQTAERLDYQLEGDQRVAPEGDLVHDVEDGSASLEDLPVEALPEDLARRSPDDRRQLLADQAARRKGLWSEVQWLTEKRRAYLEVEVTERGRALDTVIADLVRP